MNVLQIISDGGLGVRLLLVPALVGTVVLLMVRLFFRRRHAGVFEGSVLFVLGSAGVVVALDALLGTGLLAQQSAAPETVLRLLWISARTLLLASFGVALLCVLELISSIRHRGAPDAADARTSVRVTVAVGRVALALAAVGLLATLVHVAMWTDPTTLKTVIEPNPALELARTRRWSWIGMAGGWAALSLGLVTLGLAFLPGIRRRGEAGSPEPSSD
jgi:hypothetical protein